MPDSFKKDGDGQQRSVMHEDRSFLCVNCDMDYPYSELVAQTFTFQHKLENFDVEVKICRTCWNNGGISDERKKDITDELRDAQDGLRW